MISVNAKGQLVMFGTGFRARAPFWFVRPQGYRALPGHCGSALKVPMARQDLP